MSDPFTPDYKSGQEAFDSVGQAFGRGPDDEPRQASHMPHASGIWYNQMIYLIIYNS